MALASRSAHHASCFIQGIIRVTNSPRRSKQRPELDGESKLAIDQGISRKARQRLTLLDFRGSRSSVAMMSFDSGSRPWSCRVSRSGWLLLELVQATKLAGVYHNSALAPTALLWVKRNAAAYLLLASWSKPYECKEEARLYVLFYQPLLVH